MMLIDSDTDNSIIIEHEKQKKLACLKDTPLKIDNSVVNTRKLLHNDSIMDQTDGTSEESNDELPENDAPQRASRRKR